MTESLNPYTSPNTIRARTSSWFSPLALFAAGLWLVIAIGVAYGRYTLAPIYDDFALELPMVTHVLIHPLTVLFFGAVSIGLPLVGLVTPSSKGRNRAAIIAIVLAIPTGYMCAYGFFRPLIVTIHSLQ